MRYASILLRDIMWQHDQRNSNLFNTLSSLIFIGLVEVEIKCFYFATWYHVTTWSKGNRCETLRLSHQCVKSSLIVARHNFCTLPCRMCLYVAWEVGAPQPMLPLCQVWSLQVLCKCRYNDFILPSDIKWTNDSRDMQLGKQEFLSLSHHFTKCIILISLVKVEISRFCFVTWYHMTKCSKAIWLGEWQPLTLSHHLTSLVIAGLLKEET